MAALDPIARLRTTGQKLQPKLRAEIVSMGPEAIPRLIGLLDHDKGGWGSVHAVDLLVDLKAMESVEPMLRALVGAGMHDMLFSRLAIRLPELGGAVLEPALALLAGREDDSDAVYGLWEVLAKLGVKDERIFEALRTAFQVERPFGAGMLADYGDERGMALIEQALTEYECDLESDWSIGDLRELVDAHERLGGVLAADVQERVDRWLTEWALRRLPLDAASAPVKQRKIGRNEPCPCGSGKKYKKCHLALDEAARPRVVEADGDALHVSGGVTDEQLRMATQFFRDKDAGLGPAQQMVEYAQPIIDTHEGTPIQAALNMAMLFWNLAITRDEVERDQALFDMVARLDEADRAEFEQTARMMIERHETMFPKMHGH